MTSCNCSQSFKYYTWSLSFRLSRQRLNILDFLNFTIILKQFLYNFLIIIVPTSSKISGLFGERANHQNKDGRHSREKPLIKNFCGSMFSGEPSPEKWHETFISLSSCDRIFNYEGESFISFILSCGSLTIPLRAVQVVLSFVRFLWRNNRHKWRQVSVSRWGKRTGLWTFGIFSFRRVWSSRTWIASKLEIRNFNIFVFGHRK